jgi:TonB-dependent receptor
MARPELRSLRPGVSIGTAGLKSVSAGNPNISPSRARTLDAAVEWYFAPSAVLSVAAFHKTITSTVQSRVTGPDVFSANPFGLSDSLAVQACARAIGCDPNLPIWLFLTPTDSGRGQLNGLEISLQTPLSLASPRLKAWSLQAALAYSRSRILYWTKDGEMRSVNDALGAPRLVANLSLVYRRDRLEARLTSAYRDRYLSAIPAPTGGDVDGVNAVATLDVSARYAFSRQLAATFEGSNLTDAYQRQFSDSSELPNYQHRLGREYRLGLSWRH